MTQEMMGFWGGIGISWMICKQSAPWSRQITTPTPHRSIFTGWMLFLTPNEQCQSTEGMVDVKRVVGWLGWSVEIAGCVKCYVFSGEGSQLSGNSDERNLAAMARAILVHPDTVKVMYFA